MAAHPSEDLTHSALLRRWRNLESIKQECVSLATKLGGYRAIPPDPVLAAVKLEECRQELRDVSNEFDRAVAKLNLGWGGGSG